MKCAKAIIAVGGYGTRWLPITKAIEKCMLPVGNRPIVDYIVDDCIAAGITDIIFVVSEMSSQIRKYYGSNQLLQDYLARHHKTNELTAINQLATKVRFSFVTQDQNQPYGTSVPVWLAREHIAASEPFLFVYGDAILYKPGGGSAVADFLLAAKQTEAQTAMMVVPVPPKEVSKYGIVATKKRGKTDLFQSVVEKPRPGEAPSNLSNTGCFLLHDGIFPFVERSMNQPGKEQFFTDAINWYRQAGNDIAVIKTDAEFLDCGNVDGWLAANNRIVGAK